MKRPSDFFEIPPERTIIQSTDSFSIQSDSQPANTIIPHSIPLLGSIQEVSALNMSSLLLSIDDDKPEYVSRYHLFEPIPLLDG